MDRTRLYVALGVVTAVAASSPAVAGPAHVLASRVLAPVPAGATYAIAPGLDAGARVALAKALQEAGLKTVPSNHPHAYVVTVRTKAAALCTASCSVLVGHDVGPLSDAFRHVAVVAAARDNGAGFGAKKPVAWYTYLQSDGLSARTDDYLPALLRFGARAYGRNTAPEAPPASTPSTPPAPNLQTTPGA